MAMVILLAVVVVVFTVLTVLMVLVHNQIPFRSARIVATFALPIRLIDTIPVFMENYQTFHYWLFIHG